VSGCFLRFNAANNTITPPTRRRKLREEHMQLTGEALVQQRHHLHARRVAGLPDKLVPADHPQGHAAHRRAAACNYNSCQA
jgi:hypothetical protein